MKKECNGCGEVFDEKNLFQAMLADIDADDWKEEITIISLRRLNRQEGDGNRTEWGYCIDCLFNADGYMAAFIHNAKVS